MTPVIMSGGSGSRLWPVSRQARPKPFMALPDGELLLEKTLRRASALEGVREVITVTNQDHFFGTRDVYAASGVDGVSFDYVLEPVGRNTAPAIAMAAHRALDLDGPDAVILVLAADHLISDLAAFSEAVSRAHRLAGHGYLVTFGIRPDHAETGFGYIQRGEPINADDPDSRSVLRFVEKPDEETARQYLQDGGYAWNSGMFCFRADALLEALEKHANDIYSAVETCWAASRQDESPLTLDAVSFADIPAVSIDYAVMEHADNVAVVECDIGWSDIGSWDAVSALSEPDADGNRIIGDAITVDSKDCFIQTEGRLVATVGLRNAMVIDTHDALLVANRDDAQAVKQVVERLTELGSERVRLHSTVHRPWGTYTVLEEGSGFKIKRIVVYPGRELSLQMHHHRSEHWIVVNGTARVVNGDDEFLVRKNESTYIPAGNRHRLANPGVIDLVMIEVQSGDYLEEDDIVRFDDHYGRA